MGETARVFFLRRRPNSNDGLSDPFINGHRRRSAEDHDGRGTVLAHTPICLLIYSYNLYVYILCTLRASQTTHKNNPKYSFITTFPRNIGKKKHAFVPARPCLVSLAKF